MFHYTYLITFLDTYKMYIGVRSCAGEPDNDSYISSSKTVNAIVESGQPFSRKVIELYETRLAAEEAEVVLHHLFDVESNTHFINKANATFGWSAAGRIHPFKDKTYLEIYGEDSAKKKKANLSVILRNRIFSDVTRERMCKNHADVSGRKNPRAINGKVVRDNDVLFEFSHKAELEHWLKEQGMPHRAMMQGGYYPKNVSNRNKKFSKFFGISVLFNVQK